MAKRFRSVFYKLAPSWLTSGDGERVLYSLGLLLDGFVERARLGLVARWPGYDPPTDALAAMGRDRDIVRGIDEDATAYAARLIPWLDVHKKDGTAFQLIRDVQAYLGGNIMVRTVDEHCNWFTIDADGVQSYALNQGNWNWDETPTFEKRGRFWVIIYPPDQASAPIKPGPEWGVLSLWGDAWGTDGYTWGTNATPELVQSVRTLVSKRKPAGTWCSHIIIAFDPASFDPATPPGAPLPDGTWGKNSKVSGGTYVPARLTSARYWRGT
jgi:hypothetical protein